MCKNLDGKNLVNFWSVAISPNFRGAKIFLHMVGYYKRNRVLASYLRYNIQFFVCSCESQNICC